MVSVNLDAQVVTGTALGGSRRLDAQALKYTVLSYKILFSIERIFPSLPFINIYGSRFCLRKANICGLGLAYLWPSLDIGQRPLIDFKINYI